MVTVGSTVQEILNNIALCSLKIGCHHDCIAMSMASLRVAPNEKAVYRIAKALALLGEHKLALKTIKNSKVRIYKCAIE